MLIDCDTCVARDIACSDCVVAVLLHSPAVRQSGPMDLDAAEQAAIGSLAGAGLVPPLRLVPVRRSGSGPPEGGARGIA